MRVDASNMIADNPSTITITRQTAAIEDGKRSLDTAALDPITVRLYHKNTTERQMVDDETRWIRVRQPRMLCEHDADVASFSKTNLDTFTLGGRTYRVLDVRDVTWEGVVVSRQCTLEET